MILPRANFERPAQLVGTGQVSVRAGVCEASLERSGEGPHRVRN